VTQIFFFTEDLPQHPFLLRSSLSGGFFSLLFCFFPSSSSDRSFYAFARRRIYLHDNTMSWLVYFWPMIAILHFIME